MGRTGRGDGGAAVVWVLACSALVLFLGLVTAVRTTAVLARHRAQSAADLAALAAAGRIGLDADICAGGATDTVDTVAAANGAVLLDCTATLAGDGRSGTVTVRVAVPVRLAFVGTSTARATARAARDPPTDRRRRRACSVASAAPDLPVGGVWQHDRRTTRARRHQRASTAPEGNNMDLSVTTTIVGGHAVVSVNGEVDVYTAPTLRDRLNELLADGKPGVIVDMSQVGFCDSTGLGSLVSALNKAREVDVSLSLVAAQDRVLKLLRITGLDQVFTLYPSVDAAVQADGPVPTS